MGFFDIYSIAFLVIAVAIIWKLRSVLGTKTGTERPPVDRYAPPRPDAPDLRTGGDNVVPIARPPQPGAETVPGTAPDQSVPPAVPSALDAALRLLAQADATFDQAHFITGAKAAYEMIVTAFATGDRRTLKPLLSRDVFESFSSAIDARERDGHQVETKFVGIDRAEIVEAGLKGGAAEVTVRFVSQLITVTRDRDGATIDGDPNRVTEVVDIWAFARDVTSTDPNWRLVSTANG